MNYVSTITIDGPAASGKSTLGALLAKRLGYTYFDTGILYRALTYLALKHQVPTDQADALVALAHDMQAQVKPPTVQDGRQYTVLLDGSDVTWQLRAPDVERNVSAVSAYQNVRTALRDQQRAIGKHGRVVMVGRDIGTIVMPDAGFKVYLLASPEERARRRHHELTEQGHNTSYAHVLADLQARDARDAANTYQPTDALVISSDGLSPATVADRIISFIQDSGKATHA